MGKKIGIIGYGTIGAYLVGKIKKDADLSLAFVFDTDSGKLSGLDEDLVLSSIDEARKRKADLVVEVADAECVTTMAPFVLQFSDLLVVSVTAFAEQGLMEKLDAVAMRHRTRYYVSHGAIVGLDGVKDGKELIDEAHITTIRPQEGYGLEEELKSRTVLYDGPTRGACRRFPKNVNIHASLALHGLGFDRTHSTVIADPEATVMEHIIDIRGRGLAWKIEVQGKPLGERTAAYVPVSVFQTLRRICSEECGMTLI